MFWCGATSQQHSVKGAGLPNTEGSGSAYIAATGLFGDRCFKIEETRSAAISSVVLREYGFV
jgi:hypothetical protein